jgi:hypothetical protein
MFLFKYKRAKLRAIGYFCHYGIPVLWSDKSLKHIKAAWMAALMTAIGNQAIKEANKRKSEAYKE